MLPCDALDDEGDRLIVHVKPRRDSGHRDGFGHPANSPHGVIVQLGGGSGNAPGLPALCVAVAVVVGPCADEQVLGPDTARVVAVVADSGSTRGGLVGDSPGHSMRENSRGSFGCRAADGESSVVANALAGRPGPASIGLLRLRPETGSGPRIAHATFDGIIFRTHVGLLWTFVTGAGRDVGVSAGADYPTIRRHGKGVPQ